MFERVKVFISSPFEEFRAERSTLLAQLQRADFEGWDAADELAEAAGSNQDRCLERLRWSDFVVCLVGFHAGSVHPKGRDGESITEWEYRTARSLREEKGRPGIFVYVKDEIVGQLKALDRLPSLGARHRTFIAQVTDLAAGARFGKFASAEQLAERVTGSIHRALAKVYLAYQKLELADGGGRRGSGLAAHLPPVMLVLGCACLALAVGVLTDPWLGLVGTAEWDGRWRLAATVTLTCAGLAGLVQNQLARDDLGHG